MQIYALKSCDTCKKAIKALEAGGTVLSITDVRADGVPRDVLKGWLDTLGPSVLVNTRSTTWRGLDEIERAKVDTTDGALELLLAHPTLMKRPVIVTEGGVHVGWSAETRTTLGV